MLTSAEPTKGAMRTLVPALATTLFLFTLIACNSASETEGKAGQQPREGRVTAMASVIWACPLENWDLGQDDGCDPIETGTRIKIYRRNVRPDYRHGPFALIEYTHKGKQKLQYVIDMNVTPLDEEEPSVEELVERARESARGAEGH